MIRPKRPLTGRLILIAVVASLVLSSLACTKKETDDSWQMTPPVFETNSGSGVRLKMKSNQMNARNGVAETMFADESAVLIFGAADRGFEMRVSNLCSDPNQRTEEITAYRKTASAVPILSLLPPKVLSPDSLRLEWKCILRFQVKNQHGSIHEFEILNMTVRLNSIAEHIATTPMLTNASSNSTSTKLLVCPSWWVEATNTSLDAMANASVVSGEDNRDVERRPLCTVLESPAAPRVIGFFRPTFSGPRISISAPDVLIPATELPDLYNRPMLSWTVRNESRLMQTLFIATPPDAITFSPVMLWAEPYNGILDPVRTFPLFAATGAEDVRQTATGFYFRIQPGATVKLQANSSRVDITSLVDFKSKMGTSHLIVTGNNLSVMTLANQREFLNLSIADTKLLDLAMRDSVGFPLLKTAILEPEASSGKLVLGKTELQSLNNRRRIQGTDCFYSATLLQPHAPACN